MADKGTLDQLKTSIASVLDNSVGADFITPQKHNNILIDVIDTISPSFGSATGTDTYLVAMSTTQVAYSEHKAYFISFANTNTGDSTLDVDSLGVKSLRNGANNEIPPSFIFVGVIYEVRYDLATDTLRLK